MKDQPYRPKTPRETFQANPTWKHGHLELVTSVGMVAALDYAMLQMVNDLPRSDDPTSASANAWRLEGARRFRAIFVTLSEPPRKIKHTDPDQLPHV
jgi:hypothetical protein